MDKKPVVVRHCILTAAITKLHDALTAIDPASSRPIHLAANPKKIPKLEAWMKKHCVIHPYSMYIQWSNDQACCGTFHSPPEVGDLVMQRQPTPQKDSHRAGHFMCRDDVLELFANDSSALTNMSDLPSFNSDKQAMKGDKEAKKERDKKVDKETGLKSWDPKKVRSILTCFCCGKCCCIFSKENGIDYKNVSVALQQKYESVSERFTCGDLLFPDNHRFSRLLAQRTNINCESQI